MNMFHIPPMAVLHEWQVQARPQPCLKGPAPITGTVSSTVSSSQAFEAWQSRHISSDSYTQCKNVSRAADSKCIGELLDTQANCSSCKLILLRNRCLGRAGRMLINTWEKLYARLSIAKAATEICPAVLPWSPSAPMIPTQQPAQQRAEAGARLRTCMHAAQSS